MANREGIESGTAPPRFTAAPLPSPLAVAIEPSLRLQSPENGNICGAGRRLSAVGPAKTTKWEGGDRRLGRESPLLACLSHVPEDTATTGGLGRETADKSMKSTAWQKVVTQKLPLNALSFLKLDHDHSLVELSANLHSRQSPPMRLPPARHHAPPQNNHQRAQDQRRGWRHDQPWSHTVHDNPARPLRHT